MAALEVDSIRYSTHDFEEFVRLIRLGAGHHVERVVTIAWPLIVGPITTKPDTECIDNGEDEGDRTAPVGVEENFLADGDLQ